MYVLGVRAGYSMYKETVKRDPGPGQLDNTLTNNNSSGFIIIQHTHKTEQAPISIIIMMSYYYIMELAINHFRSKLVEALEPGRRWPKKLCRRYKSTHEAL
uniref:Uncharacterized protein n=1 Tax=Cacopsylla melanoneura TaxID=428564 RepID=A0A8D8TQS7_9HEMI